MGYQTCRVAEVTVVNRMVRIDMIEKARHTERQERKPSS